MKRTLAALVVLFSTTAAVAQQTARRVLLPVAMETVAGANGSLWSTELWFHANSEEGVSIIPLSVSDAPPFRHVSIRLPIFYAHPGQPPGQFLVITRGRWEDKELNLRVRDLSRGNETWGTEIPVVPEDEFRTKTIALLPVPLGSGFRAMVRIYGLEQTGGAVRVKVTTIEDEPSVPLGVVYDHTLQLPPTASQFAPPYTQLALYVELPASNALARVEIEPLTPGLAFWAFASITDNETQHVTVVSPQ
jgi:hypothetical protein